jgi:hypothetical protein
MIKCVWGMNSPCGGDVSNKSIFSGQITVPICASHYNEHLVLLTLNRKFEKDIEAILSLSCQERADMLAALTSDVDTDLKETAKMDAGAVVASE